MTDERARPVPWLEYAILFVLTVAALELKRPFGLLAHQVFGPPGTGGGSPFALSTGELVQLGFVLVAFAIHRYTGLPASPRLEGALYGWHRDEKLALWRPVLVSILAVLVYVAVYAAVVSHMGLTSKLGSQLHAPNLPKAVVIKMALLYPLAAIGAGVHEEMVFRFGLVSIAFWALLQIVPSARGSKLWIWLPIVAVGIYFGYVHVAENIETVRTGNIVLDVLTTPQTFAGIVFGYAFCAYGLEAAMLTHMSCDLIAPFLLKVLQAMH